MASINTTEELIKRASNIKLQYPELRWGQSLMNELNTMDSDLYVEITAGPIDIFYTRDDNNGTRIQEFLEFVTKRWSMS